VNQPAYDAAGEWTEQWQRDIRRDELLHANGWIIIKVTARDLFLQPLLTLGRIRDALLSRGWRP
jgi:very-short-patch-repair endonuclease